MNNIFVLILDTNVTVRLTLSHIIRETGKFSVTGAYDSKEIDDPINLIKESNTSVLLIGIDEIKSHEMDLFLLIRKRLPSLPVIAITPLNEDGAYIAIEAMKHGAVDYITRPVNPNGALLARNHFVKRLIPLLESVPRLNLKATNTLIKPEINGNQVPVSNRNRTLKLMEIVVISGCTGGVQALYPLISSFPENMSVPVIIVQHMPKIYTRVLAMDLDLLTPLNVHEATNNSVLLPGHVYVIPGGYHAEVKNNSHQKIILLHRGPRERDNRPSIDVLIRSVNQVYQNRALNLVLSGSGEDGLNGAKALIDAGGQVILQNPTTSLLWDLPRKIVNMGYYSGLYHPKHIGFEISQSTYSQAEQPPAYKYPPYKPHLDLKF
jgi:two-component system chemotaxis response regulator CheB